MAAPPEAARRRPRRTPPPKPPPSLTEGNQTRYDNRTNRSEFRCPTNSSYLDLIATSNQGVLAAVTRDGYPHLTNVLYVWDPAEKTAHVSTTADRVKGRILQRDPHAALHVAGTTLLVLRGRGV